ncbi:MAG: hypothetical protein NTZ44_03675 [Candidatus Nomurabacteria bacterium]|nr:hypothetical protein [Candidatus Nomurabacteria bacterium]
METRNCQNCKKDFTIEVEDFNFYQKIKVPPPTWCPECRLIRRLAYREERSFYKDECDKCGHEIVSLFAPESDLPVFCSPCWWSDSWDATSYGKDYDFSRPFFEQLYQLMKVVPNQATNTRNCTDCKYSHGNIRCKNCTFVFAGIQSINCYYCSTPIFTKDSFDSSFIINADHVYEGVHIGGIYNSKFIYFSDECLDCSFIFNCVGCSDCFGCVNLRNQKYCIFNIQYSKEEYKKEILKWDLGSYENLQKARELFMKLYHKTPRRFALISNSTNCIGDDIQNTKNCKICFSATHGVENSKFIFQCGLLLKDSYDVTLGGDTSELAYEVNGSTQSQKSFFCRGSNNLRDVEYSDNIYNGSNLFGCVKLRHKKYCILNKQYTKEEYEDLIPKIKQHMIDMPYVDKKGRVYKYGEFFPVEIALFAYNETWAHQYFPITKEKAIEQGYNWRDPIERDYKITINIGNLHNHIKDVTDSILDEVIECEHNGKNCNQQCTTAFRILPNELGFYRQMNLALPRICPNCRHYERLKKTNPPKLWHGKCMCDGVESSNKEYRNTIKHLHGEEPCQNEFETSISSERKEIVYCEKCYQDEFI